MPTFDTIRQEADERALIRKIQKAVAFVAPNTVDLPTTLFGVGGQLVDLKALGWLPVGMVTPDGYEFGRDINKEDVTALGYASAVRSDITEVARSITMTPLAFSVRTISMILSTSMLASSDRVIFSDRRSHSRLRPW